MSAQRGVLIICRVCDEAKSLFAFVRESTVPAIYDSICCECNHSSMMRAMDQSMKLQRLMESK